MKTNNSKPYFSKMTLISLACAASLGGTATDAQAQNLGQCLKNTLNCGVKIAQTQIDLLSAATDVIAFTASSPHCIADIVAGNFVTMGISASMVSLAATGVIKQEGGSYINYIYGRGGRPMVQAVSSIVPVPAISNLLKENDDALIGTAFKGITSLIPIPSAGAPTLERQLDCGNAIAVAGQGMIGKVKSFVGHAKGAVKSCSAAATCFAGVLLDIVKDPVGALGSAGEFLVDGADSLKDAIFGGCKNQDTQLFFNTNIKPWANPIAYDAIWGGNPNAYDKAKELVANCVGYYDGCNSDPDTAKRQCVVMSSGAVQTDGNGWIAGKGLEQLVRTRQMELRIPQFLATDMKWALAQPTGGKDTAMINQQFARLPTQLQPLVKAKFSFSFKPAREAAVRKIMGFAPGYSGNGDFGGKDAKVAMADQSIGALMLAYVPTQGAENKSTNTKINDLYKQYIPNGDALLQQIDAAVAESMRKDIVEVVKQNGDAWNDAFTNTQLQKMVKRMDDCKDAHKDAQKTCKQNIATAIEGVFAIMPGMGKGKNFAGIGALGMQDPAYINYVNFIQGADATVGKHIAQSALVMLSESQLPPTSIAATPGQQPGAIAAAPPKSNAPATTSPIGMPSAPTMAMVAINTAKPASTTNPSAPNASAHAAKAPSSTAPAAPPGGAVVANQPPVSDKQAVTPSNNNAPPKSAVDLLPFDATAYRKVREKQIEDEWFPKCSAQAQCLKTMDEITEKLLNAEVAALKAGTPLHTDKAAVAAFQNSLDPIYDPQFKSAVPKVVVASQPPTGQATTNNPPSPAKSVVALLPFDATTYRRVREKEIKDEWLPKCGVIVICQRKMEEIAQSLLSREVTALSNGTPLHTDKAAVAAFQNSLDLIFDPQFKAAIPPTATTATTPSGPSTFSNKKPDFKPKF